jgi:hypothetical protein
MNTADIVADRLIQRGIYLERYKAGFNGKILAEIETLEDSLTRELASSFSKGVPNNSVRIQRLENLLAQSRQIIRSSYANKKSLAGKELLRLAANEQTYVVGAVNEGAGIDIAKISLNYDELKKLTDGTLIEGAKSAEWWGRQSEDLQKRFSDQMRQGVLRGETLDQLTARVRGTQARAYTDGIMQVSKRQAEALVHTSVQTIANETRLATYEANATITSALQWISTLDGRTTHICMALSNKLWTTKTKAPIGHSIKWPGVTAHWRCRSTQIPVLKKWEDLVAKQDEAALDAEFKKQLAAQGFSPEQIAGIKRNTRSSMDGQVAKDISFDDWLKVKTPEFQDSMLGKGRGRLFRDGKITMTDLIDQRGRPLTIDQLEALPQPRPGPKPIKLPEPRKAKPAAPAPTPKRAPDQFPPAEEVEVVRKLGGSTGAELVKDTQNGELYVRKLGATPDHLREELAADQAYRAAGIDVPRGIFYETPTGPVKLTQYIEGQSLADFIAKATPAQQAEVIAKIRKGFATDALMANHDVAGLSMDNILVDAKGTPWRIDNGGSLRYRAMGAPKTSATWNGAVQELETMRDASINPQTARLFGDLTELDIEEQIRDVLTREDAIMAALPDPAKPIMRERFATLRARLDSLINETVAKRVREAKIQGVALPSDRDEFEDVQALFWQELGLDGQPLTAAKVKLTTNGSEKVMAAIRDSIQKKAVEAVAKTLPEDTFWERIFSGIKTINTHAGDGAYNKSKIAGMMQAKAELSSFEAPTAALQKMKVYYEEMLLEAETSMATKSKTPTFKQFVLEPPKKTPKVRKKIGKLKVTEESLTWPVKTYTDGIPRQTGEKITVKGSLLQQEGYVIELGDVRVRYIPYRATNANDWLNGNNAQALMGTLELEIPGEASRQTLSRAVDAMKQIGLSPDKASSDYLEAVWLRKTLAMQTDLIDNKIRTRMREIMELPGMADSDRVAHLRLIASEKLGMEPPKNPAMWTPKPDARGRGWGYTERWDMPASAVAKEMKGFSLTHATSAYIPDLVGGLLEQGGELTSTVERVRKGIVVATGMSPEQDLTRGGATHLYTRIKRSASAYKQTGFVFKPTALARQDAFSFDSDWYGGVHNFFATDRIYKARAKTINELKIYALGGANETLFKWNLSILDELDMIVVNSASERASVVQKFHAAGIKALPDGRSVETIVRLSTDPIK